MWNFRLQIKTLFILIGFSCGFIACKHELSTSELYDQADSTDELMQDAFIKKIQNNEHAILLDTLLDEYRLFSFILQRTIQENGNVVVKRYYVTDIKKMDSSYVAWIQGESTFHTLFMKLSCSAEFAEQLYNRRGTGVYLLVSLKNIHAAFFHLAVADDCEELADEQINCEDITTTLELENSTDAIATGELKKIIIDLTQEKRDSIMDALRQ
jgi:hypothetical protein